MLQQSYRKVTIPTYLRMIAALVLGPRRDPIRGRRHRSLQADTRPLVHSLLHRGWLFGRYIRVSSRRWLLGGPMLRRLCALRRHDCRRRRRRRGRS